MRVVDRGHALGVAVLRIAVGIVFLWAGLEKFFGAAAPGWTAAGFLKFATAGTLSWPFVSGEPAKDAVFNPTHDFWVGLAGNAQAMSVIDTLVVFGETAIGIALILGLVTRFASIMGTLMMLFFFVAAWQFSTGIVNQHLTYAVVIAFLGYIGAGNYYGLDAIVAKNMSPALKKWIFSGEDVAVPTPA
jgi:thiosulfate dehydrogenase [quinone] large subunit